ncbi:MAG: peptidoglycan editing factor PgeF [Rubricoccaceae bacterium]
MPESILCPSVFKVPVVAGFTTRQFSSAEETLDTVRTRVGKTVGMPVSSVGQVHRADVAVVREPGHIPEHDGLVTNVPGLLLTVVAADCALVLLADREAGVIGACHSGWRGTVAGITGETIRAMESLGASSRRIRAYLAPCISVDAFEVGEEVAAQFDESVVQRREAWPRPHVDLKAELVRQLDAAGVARERMEVSEGCTIRNNAQFYSYRAEGGTPGRMIGFIGLSDG